MQKYLKLQTSEFIINPLYLTEYEPQVTKFKYKCQNIGMPAYVVAWMIVGAATVLSASHSVLCVPIYRFLLKHQEDAAGHVSAPIAVVVSDVL